jgi:hypothetical protein
MNQTFCGEKPATPGNSFLQVTRRPFHHLLAVAFGLLRLDNR